MATANTIHLTPGQWPEYFRQGISQESTGTANDLLQKNHENFHIFFNKDGFHNHIAHQLLTVWALRADSKDIQMAYDTNAGYQRPQEPTDSKFLSEMHDIAKFKSHLGKEEFYHDYMIFFQDDISQKGLAATVNKYLLAGDDLANDMLARLFGGFLHPLIHFGFGIEFQQPAIVAESLAQTAVHDNWMGRFLFSTEKAATEHGKPTESIVQLLDDIRADKDLSTAAKWSDGNKLRNGIVARAGPKMVEYASQYSVQPNDDLERKTAEMINAAAYYTAGAQRPDRAVRYDFYYMHCVNASIFYSAFLKQDWISQANKVRLLNWKVWNDLAMYASRRSPEIRLDIIRSYKPKEPSGWDEIEDRVVKLEDDGHASKLVRALAHGQRVCQPYADREEFRVKHDDWLQMGHMAIDSTEETGSNGWVRSAGFDEAWENVPTRAQL